ncbi:MAG: pilus assembly FimT family protein [Planctomycetota bacterium]|jgi:type II secretory pathway pseudopilin PulG
MQNRGVRRGFLYVDMLVALTIMVLLATIVLPSFADDSHIRVVAAAEIVTSDIELAQVMSIASPEDPVVVVFNSNGYILAYASDTATPIDRPADANGFGGEPYSIEFGEGRARQAADVAVTVDTAPEMIAFNGLGTLDTPMPVTVRLTFGTRWIDLEVSPTTGSITQTAGEV